MPFLSRYQHNKRKDIKDPKLFLQKVIFAITTSKTYTEMFF